ncbi:hypothetical protein SAY87_016133 [Trapa incisa]|uniref:Uncharacterized protein n=1 Tax=Trapa incisa TaxID=236973 RepID=A0AAN7L5K4_9MYRT|nr:hypothetical protein SAY87_016133 [Trapa incisa]
MPVAQRVAPKKVRSLSVISVRDSVAGHNMDTTSKLEKKNHKRGLITKTLERCKFIRRGGGSCDVSSSAEGGRHSLTKKSRPWNSPRNQPGGSADRDQTQKNHRKEKKHQIVPEGCFSVYVGPEKQRFVIRTECANHPLFRMLLEEAEAEYGYCCSGPLELPCGVDMFRRVMVEMESDDDVGELPRGCGFAHGGGGSGYKAYRLLSPYRMLTINQF